MVALALAPAKGARPRGRYQAADTRQTLAEGLAEYYALNAGRVSPPASLPPESRDLFRRHDICHVIFGLDTTLADEAMADSRTLMQCDVGFRRYAAYLGSDAQAKAVFKEVGYLTVLWGTVATLPRILKAAVAAFRTRKRWPWSPPEAFLDRPIVELRRAYDIKVI